MTRRKASPAAPAGGEDQAEPWTRECVDCVPSLWIQGGAWGWQAHRHQIHGEGEDPGDCPYAAPRDRPLPPRWTAEQHAEFHARRRAARRGERYAPRWRPPDGPPSRAGTG